MRAPKHIIVALGLVVSDGRVLLTQRREPALPELDFKWEIPGGKVHPGEPPERASERELLEETGVVARADYLLPFTYTAHRRYNDHELFVTILCMKCTFLGQQPTRPDPKVGSIAWFPFAEIPLLGVLPGSREFLLHLARSLGQSLPGSDVPNTVSFIEFQRIEPKVNCQRRYCLTLRLLPSDSSPYLLTRLWGRIGAVSRAMHQSFVDEPAARDAFIRHCERRITRGYDVIDVDRATFPDLAWLRVHFQGRHSPQLSLFEAMNGPHDNNNYQ